VITIHTTVKMHGQLVTRSSRHTVISSHGQLVTQSTRHNTAIHDGQLVTPFWRFLGVTSWPCDELTVSQP